MGCMSTDDDELPIPPNGYKYMPCRYCERGVLVRVIRKRAASHTECSVNAMMANARDIQSKSGPGYERWRDGIVKSLDRSAQGGPPPIA